MKQITCILFFTLISAACTQIDLKTNSEDTNIQKKHNTYSTIDTIKPPQIVLLDSCPKPQVIFIPKKIGGAYIKHAPNGIQRIELKPPVIIPLPINNKKGTDEKIQSVQGMGFFTNYTTDQGLALDEIHYSCVDHFGNIWFSTGGGGVSRYDGKSFTNFSTSQGLASNLAGPIVEDKRGNIWICTEGGGVSRYDGKSFLTLSKKNGLAYNNVRSIIEDKNGNFWFGTYGGGVSYYNGKSFINYTTQHGLANNYVMSIAIDKSENIWFGTKGGVSKYDGKSFTNYTKREGLSNNDIRCIKIDKTGKLWLASYGGGISKYDGKSFINYSTKEGLINNYVWTIQEDKNGNLWFGTVGGVSKYDGSLFTNFTIEQGLANNDIRNLVEDNSGNIWFCTYGGGINCYAGKSFTNYTAAQGLAKNWVNTIFEDKKGNLWFCTYGGGVSKYDGKSFTNYTTAQGIANNIVRNVIEDNKSNLWFGTENGGVSKYDGKSFTNYTTKQGLIDNVINCIKLDKNGNLWFGTEKGLSIFNGKYFTNYTKEQGLPVNWITYIFEDKTGIFWLGMDYGGISRFDGKNFVNFNTSNGLANNHVIFITEDKKGNLWFGTVGGLSILNSKKRKYLLENKGKVNKNEIEINHLFTNFNTQDGLPDNIVTQISENDNGDFYVGTNLGICELKAPIKDDDKPILGRIFNSSTGYPVKDVNWGQNTMYKDSKGIIWIGTGSDKTALVRFDPTELKVNPNPPKLFLQRVLLNEEKIDWYQLDNNEKDSLVKAQQQIITYGKGLLQKELDSLNEKYAGIQFDSITKFYPIPQNLKLPYHFNHISFEFAAIEPALPFMVNYQYILKGYDKQWSQVTHKSEVSFGNMYEGSYTFFLKAQSPDGVWSNPISYSFIVLPPWYRHWLAYLIYIVLLGLGIWIYIKWRLSNQIRLQQEEANRKESIYNTRSQIAQDIHDDLGTDLSKISMGASVASMMPNLEKEVLRQKLHSISLEAQEVAKHLRDVVFITNPQYDAFTEVQSYYKEKSSSFLESVGLEAHFDLSCPKNNPNVLPEVKRELFLLLRECLNNIAKHANAKKVNLKFIIIDENKADSTNYLLEICDNGTGFDPEKTHHFGNGLKSISKRAGKIGAKLEILSILGKGTTIRVIGSL